MLRSGHYLSLQELQTAMNFLVRTAYPIAPEVPSDTEVQSHTSVPTSTLEGLIAEESSPSHSTEDDADAQSDGFGDVGSSAPDSNSSNQGKHSDISEDDGWIAIPNSMSSCASHHFFNHLGCYN